MEWLLPRGYRSLSLLRPPLGKARTIRPPSIDQTGGKTSKTSVFFHITYILLVSFCSVKKDNIVSSCDHLYQ